jgi:Anti-sigma regulatory factor (Ser/Thr protein kinase)
MSEVVTQRWEMVREPKFVREVRDRARAVLAAWGADEAADDVTLMLSELVTNALAHGDGRISVSLSLNPVTGTLTCAVGDETADGIDRIAAGLARRPDPLADDLAEGGRGLTLVALLATDWGVRRTPRAGKAVWFTYALR